MHDWSDKCDYTDVHRLSVSDTNAEFGSGSGEFCGWYCAHHCALSVASGKMDGRFAVTLFVQRRGFAFSGKDANLSANDDYGLLWINWGHCIDNFGR